MRMPSLILAAVAATLLTGLASAQEKANPPGKDKTEDSAKKVKDLQKERIAVLKDVVEMSFKLAKSARIDLVEVLEARMSLLKAELEATDKESDRIALYKAAIDALKEYEEVAKAKFDSGRATELNVHRAKAMRLEVEIALEKAKEKEAKKGK